MAQRSIRNGALTQVADGDIAWTFGSGNLTAFWDVVSPPASTGQQSHTLRLPFDFGTGNPPLDAPIDGLRLELAWFKSGVRELLDASVLLMSDAIGVWSADRAAGVNIPAPVPPALFTSVFYGGVNDVWGETPDALDIHDDIEARIKLEIDSGVSNASIELVYAELTVFFTPSAEWIAQRTCYDLPQSRPPLRRKIGCF